MKTLTIIDGCYHTVGPLRKISNFYLEAVGITPATAEKRGDRFVNVHLDGGIIQLHRLPYGALSSPRVFEQWYLQFNGTFSGGERELSLLSDLISNQFSRFLVATQPILELIAKDFNRDPHGTSWSWFALIRFSGTLKTEPNNIHVVSREQIGEIYAFLERHEVVVRAAGNGGAGQRFANEPWIQWFPSHILVSQSGGLDV